MRAFVGLRRARSSQAALSRRLDELERETRERLGEHDEQLEMLFAALRELTAPPPKRRQRVGFSPPVDDGI
jgi:hypothetical protein